VLIVEIKKEQKRSSSIVIYFSDDDKVLLLKRKKDNSSVIDYAGKWGLVGGKSEEGETPKEAAIRETNEESGLKVLPEDLIMIATIKSPQGYPVYVFACKKFQGTVNAQSVAEEHDDYRWVSIDKVDKYDTPENTMSLIKKAISMV
jgi:mutator protein MutT